MGPERLLPLTAPARRRWLEGEVARTWRAWGYREVATPVWQSWDEVNLARLGVPDQACKVLDQFGQVLALRPDMTIPIARLAAGDLADEPRPLRLFYLGDIFRRNRLGGLEALPQAGVELIGSASPAADAEVLAMAAEALHGVGLNDFRLAVGHVAVLQALLEGAGLGARSRETVLAALQRRDYVVLQQALAGESGLGEERRHRLFRLLTAPIAVSRTGGGRTDVAGLVAEAGPVPGPLLDDLGRVLELLDAQGLAGFVTLELGLVRDLNYYTGVVFEVSCPGAARPLGGGGRYDSLVGQFGRGEPATGLALEVEGVLQALEARGLPSGGMPRPADVLVAAEADATAAAWARACSLRREGYAVEVDLGDGGRSGVAERAARRGIARVLVVGTTGEEWLETAAFNRAAENGVARR